jgi:predicted TIM-barrel fold metal-dependent hydrolase
MTSSRRDFFKTGLGVGVGSALLPAACSAPSAPKEEETGPQLNLLDFEPRSMLVTEENPVASARYPVIDMHTHVSSVMRRTPTPGHPLQGTGPERLDQIVRWMDELNIQTLVNLTGGAGDGLEQTMTECVDPHPGRIVTCTVPSYDKLGEPDYPTWQADELGRAKEAGAVGLKISKTLGLYLREGGFRQSEREEGQEGPLVKIDDPRFDPMWDAAGKLGFPVFIHVADPDAFFTPTDRFNERWEELGNHPRWSFYGEDFPAKAELLAARDRVIERHPSTTFIGLHVGNHSEDLDDVSSCLERYPNFNVEIGARLGELGRQPRRSRRFFEEYQDRVMFGTDASPNGTSVPQQDLEPNMFQLYFRFLETLDEYFDYAPSPTPPQGRWKIYGIGLPDEILKKVYHNNGARIMGMKTV